MGWIFDLGDIDMPLPDAPDYSKRIYELLKETDLENLTYSQFQGVAEKLFIEPENEDEMRRLVLVQLARMAVRGDWDGFLTGGGGSGAPTDAEYVVMALNGTLTDERVLTAGSRITITDGGAGGNVTIAADASPVTSLVAGTNITLSPASGLGDVTITAASGSGIGGSIANTQVAVGSGTDTISGAASLAFSSSTLTVANQIELGDTGAAGILKNSNNNQDMRIQVAGTGNVRIENQTTDTASQLNVKGNGSGTPLISLSNDTKAVSLQCDTNQKLTVKGGTEEFVLDVSSASGGITFPDGTTQTTAASGGSGGVNPLSFSTSQGLAVTAYWLLGLNPAYASAFDSQAYTTSHTGFLVKFQPPFTGTSGLYFYTSVASASADNYLWIYEESATGYAGTFVAKILLPTSSTGGQSATQWLDAAGSNISSPTFTQGDTYIAVLEINSSFTASSGRQGNIPFVTIATVSAFSSPAGENFNQQYTGTIDASLPDSEINFFASSVGWPMLGLSL